MAGVVGGVGATRKQADPALVSRALGPPFGYQDVRIVLGQLQSIAYFRFLEIHAINHFGILANQTDGCGLISRSTVPSVVSARGLVRGTLPFARAFPIHCGANTLRANNMPIVDGTKLGLIGAFGFGCLAGKAAVCPLAKSPPVGLDMSERE